MIENLCKVGHRGRSEGRKKVGVIGEKESFETLKKVKNGNDFGLNTVCVQFLYKLGSYRRYHLV